MARTPGDGADSLRDVGGLGHDLAGQILDARYEVGEQIGSGAFAVTFHGRDLRLNRSVAIKILRHTYAADTSSIQRFEREAKAAAAVTHSNVVAVYDVGRQGDHPYIVMQYIAGDDLKHLIAREGPFTSQRAVAITVDILAGLAAIHEAGIIHRDIKPQNVLVGRDGVTRVADFGIASLSEEAGLTTVGTVMGTAAYMAPEQAEAQPLSYATDLYAVGIVLYEMLTGRLPFDAPTTYGLIVAHLHSTPAPPSFRAPMQDIAPALDAVVMRALAKRPDDRFPDARTMARALTAAVEPRPVRSAMASAVTDEDTVHIRTRRLQTGARTWPVAPARVEGRSGRQEVNQRRRARGQSWLVALAVLLFLIGSGAGIGLFVRSLTDGDDPPGDDPSRMVAFLDPSVTTDAPVTSTPADTPVPPPAPTTTPAPTATSSPSEAPTSTLVPTPTEAPTLATLIPHRPWLRPRRPPQPQPRARPVLPQIRRRSSCRAPQMPSRMWRSPRHEAASANLSLGNEDGASDGGSGRDHDAWLCRR